MPTPKPNYRAPKPPIKIHGGKHYLAKWIISLQPKLGTYKTRAEHCCGGASWMLQQDPNGIGEIVNDVDGCLIKFWKVLANEKLFKEFQLRANFTPFSMQHFQDMQDMADRMHYASAPVDVALAFFIRCRMSMAGRRKTFTPITTSRLRRGMNAEVSAWLSAVEGLPEVYARVRQWLVLNCDVVESMRKTDNAKTLHYIDPPYLPRTRVSPDVYDYEMTQEQHAAMLKAAVQLKGKVMISGYWSELYDKMLAGWTCHKRSIVNHSSSSKEKELKVECLWCNY